MTPGSPALLTGLFGGIRHSVRKKLMLVVLATTFLALLLMGVAMMVYDLRTTHDAWVSDLFIKANLIGHASAPALAFDDENVARENLALLKDLPKVSAAAIYTAKGALLASYTRAEAGNQHFPALPESDGYRIEGNQLILFKRIQSKREIVGTVYLKTSYELMERLRGYVAILASVMVVSLVVAVLMTSWLQQSVTGPILAITGVARQVMARRDFSLRVDKSTDDEIGYMVDTFNAMLAEIGGHTEALEASNRTLHQEMGERRSAEKALLAADRQKDQFLATLAHELRNPLAPLLNALEVLRLPGNDGRASLATRELMERQLRQLVQLVDDLLDVSRIGTGKLVLRKQQHELGAIVRVAMEAVAPLIQARQHRLDLSLPNQPVVLMADAARLSQVFVNLLINAAKFTDPGGKLAFSVQAGADSVTITVSDNGIGIPQAMLPLIFDLFAQADRSLERPQAGLGVGLSLAWQLVQLHGGSITAHSDGADRGSRFTVCLPCLPRSAAGDPASPHETPSQSGRFRILLADDNVDFAESLSILLEAGGHEVVVTHDGMQALETAAAFKPELCFLDIGLPRLHGYDLVRRLRALPATRGACMVAISGWGQPEDKRRSREAGFDHHLAKPVEFERIQELLDQIAANRQAS